MNYLLGLNVLQAQFLQTDQNHKGTEHSRMQPEIDSVVNINIKKTKEMLFASITKLQLNGNLLNAPDATSCWVSEVHVTDIWKCSDSCRH